MAQGTTCTASYTYAGDANHLGSNGSAAVSITRAPVIVNLTNVTAQYDGTGKTVGVSTTQTALTVVTYTAVSPASNVSTPPLNAGIYTATASLIDSSNYAFTAGSVTTATLTINKAPSFTTVTGGTFTYDGMAHAATVVVSGVGGLNLTPLPLYTGTCSSAPVTVAEGTSCLASYAYVGDVNHSNSSGSATVTINPAPPSGGFAFTNFSNLSQISLRGSSGQVENQLRLIKGTASPYNAGTYAVGAAWYQYPVTISSGFTTTFQFKVTQATTSGIADGFAFVIQKNPAGKIFLGGGDTQGGYLGYNGMTNSLAVEFDTYDNGSGWDPDANHVAIQSNGAGANSVFHNGTAKLDLRTDPGFTIADGNVHTIKIVYTSSTKILHVYSVTGNVETPLLKTQFTDLANWLGADDVPVYVGFTAATGAFAQNTDLLSWSFTN
ncbi:MAG: hypothetical protein HYZ37_04530 [Candidatus Solibacter usitatus]|nr:hypothetical protein [Candidatus Solibacter usitatus]